MLIWLLACAEPDKDGPPTRPANPTCLAPARPSTGGSVGLEQIWSDQRFSEPVALLQAPGDERWFVVEQSGRVQVVEDGVARVWLDLRDVVEDAANETGFLGMAFHPDYAENGQVFVSYTRGTPYVSVVSRMYAIAGEADPEVEEVILTLEQPYSNHNGGTIAFGPDGYLYLGFGDGGSAGDPLRAGQDKETWLGKMLRVDVDGGTPYAIPPDNPYADGGGAPEIYALGLRNPWKFSFDRATGELWAGDVGQDAREEIDRIELGGNYGWSLKEGTACYYAEEPCEGGGLIDPIVEYNHRQGVSVTGGYVYRGREMPGYQGSYFYADYVSGTIWALGWDPVTGEPDPQVAIESGLAVATFGEGHDGELLVASHTRGTVYRLVAEAVGDTVVLPETLTETGCFDADGEPVDALIPYEVNAPLWSDGAQKARWFAIPDGTTIALDADGDFEFPVGTVLAKEFSLGGERAETRLFVRHDDGEWAGYSWAWEGGTTRLLAAGDAADFDGQTWIYPSRAECLQCHTDVAGRSLGLEARQVDRRVDGDSQLELWHTMGLISGELPDVAPLSDATTESAARAYLHANCAGCHRPDGPGRGTLDLRVTTAFADMGLCDVPPEQGDLGIADAVLLAPGDPDRSLLVQRMKARDADRMPPLGTQIVDADGVGAMEAWVREIGGCP